MTIVCRLEEPKDYRAVEVLTREAFWGCMGCPVCDGEHLLVHKLRDAASLVPALDYVAEIDGELAGHVIYSLAHIVAADGKATEVLTFGPLSVLPKYKRAGVGTALMQCTIGKARELGYRAIVLFGHPDYYPRFGFRRASEFSITADTGDSFDAVMAMPLYDGALDGVCGRVVLDSVYDMKAEEVAAFDLTFPEKEPAKLATVQSLADEVPAHFVDALLEHGIKYISQVQMKSGAEMLRWVGVTGEDVSALNRALSKRGHPQARIPAH